MKKSSLVVDSYETLEFSYVQRSFGGYGSNGTQGFWRMG